MRRLRCTATAFVVLASVLVVGHALSAGTLLARMNMQEPPSWDVNSNGCVDSDETPEWQVPPVLLAGPPSALADPAGPPVDVGPSLYEFTLSEGEVYLPGCDAEAEAVLVVDGAVALTVPDADPANANYVSFASDERSGQCAALEDDGRTCRFERAQTVTLGSGDYAYHPRGATYAYAAATADGGTGLTPSAQSSPAAQVAAGGVRTGAPLAQPGGRFRVTSKWSKPQGCGGDCM